jgi:RHS repeat-associated protein
MTYEAFGAITRANYGNGTRMIQSWGNDGRLANRRLELSATSVRLSSFTYSYDNNDNFTAIADTLDATNSRTYAYDAMDRLTRITGTPGAFAREDFIYDTNGNRLRVERRATATTVAATQTDTYTIAANTNRLTSLATNAGTFTYTHDGRGNQSVEQWPDGSVITVAYDGFARLTRYKVGLATQAMLYNGDDERIRVVTTPTVGPSDTRIYMYDLDHRIVGEYGAGGVTDVKAEYIWTLPEVGAAGPTGGDDGAGGYMPLAIVKGAASDINWVHSHHNAKPILLTNSTGAVVAYGGHAVLGFPGQFANAVGLAGAQYYYNRFRDYHDTTGRYIQADPIGLAGDANPYAYAIGNTLRYTDPDGLQPVPRAVLPPQLLYRPANAFDAQISVLNARGRELNPRYQGFRQLGNGATAQDVMVATNMFARTQAAWAATNRICLDSVQPGAGYRQPQQQWPILNGAIPGTQRYLTLNAGTVVARVGSGTGRFAAPVGTPIGQRSLSPQSRSGQDVNWRLNQDVQVTAGTTAPWFGQSGGGTQYHFPGPINTYASPR